jgi:3-oxoacyl-[acyl-carrier-protein] synthase-3
MQISPPRLAIHGLASALPSRRVTSAELATRFAGWSHAGEIDAVTGIAERRYAAPGETAADLAVAAAEKLFAGGLIRAEIDFLIFCTETPDYILPASACLLQDRLGLSRRCAAFDVNLGCSGWVYSLAIAQGFLSAGLGRHGLVLTADTISTYLNPADRATTLLFGDAATATAVGIAQGDGGLTHVVLGSDGAGGRHLLVPTGGARRPRPNATAPTEAGDSGDRGGKGYLFMNGPEILNFTLREVPASIRQCLDEAHLAPDDIQLWVFHQASKLVLDALQRKFRIPPERMVRRLRDVGNTVGSALPLALEAALREGRVHPGDLVLLSGFGVGLSWATALMTWGDQTVIPANDTGDRAAVEPPGDGGGAEC